MQQLQAYEDIIKQTYLSSSIPGGNNLLAVTALDKSLSGSVLLESSVSSILFKGINKKIWNISTRGSQWLCLLCSFKLGDTKLVRFLPKSNH